MDERVFDAFPSALDEHAVPEETFVAALRERLYQDLGFRRASRRASVADRLSGVLGLHRPMPSSRPMRLVALGTLALLVLALLLMIVIIAGQLRPSLIPVLSGEQIVTQSQALYPEPPAFDMTVDFGASAVLRFRFDGVANLRTDVASGSFPESGAGPGSYRVQIPTQEAIYNATRTSWRRADLPALRPPLFSMYPLNWIAQLPYSPPATPPRPDCAEWHRLPDGTVAGRPAYHVDCPGTKTTSQSPDFWIDTETLLVVGAGPTVRATMLTVNPTLDASLFDTSRPAAAFDEDNPPPSTVLVVGQPAPEWTGPLLGGGTFNSHSLLGKPAAIFFWTDWCGCGDQMSLALLDQAAREHPSTTVISVAWASTNEAAVQAMVDSSGFGEPVVLDDGQGPILTTWGLSGVPMLVLLRADGTVAGVHVGAIQREQLEAVLSALEAGAAIPAMTPIASDSCGCSAPPH